MVTRREVLALGLSTTVALAGCTGRDDSGTPADGRTTGSPATTGTTTAIGEVGTTGGSEPTMGGDTTTGAEDGGLPVRLETVTDRPASPLAFAEAPDGSYYVADRPGRIYRLDGDSVGTALDVSETVVTGGERGLLGMALHPEFGTNGLCYVRYSAAPRSGTPSGYSHTFVLSEFHVREDGTIDPDSERTLLEIPEPQSNHNSGSIAFGPDGYLYVGVGDGGAGGDRGPGHVEDWYDANAGGNGQDVTENLLGSLLRIDPDGREGNGPYGIPEDNPLVGEAGLDGHYAWGLRNPWGISFDGEDCYVADVGQNRYEEVNRIERGGNYGWNVREGTHCYAAEDCPTVTPDGERLRDPVVEYPHSGREVSGVAVVGGHVYRGETIPALSGRYVFGDLNADGRLFVATPADDGLWPTEVLEVGGSSGEKLGRLLAIGRDRADELYVLTASGVHRIVPS